MNNPIAGASWQPYVQEALDELEKENRPRYITKEELDLEQTADSEPWDIPYCVRQTVDGPDKMEVELIDSKTNLRDVQSDMRIDDQVGLVVMGKAISRFVKPYLIVLTTKKKIYCIDPSDKERGIAFLATQLKDSRYKFWVTNGVNEADALYHHYKIDLATAQANVVCCTGIHVTLMQTMRHASGPYKQLYPVEVQNDSQKAARHEKFDKLVRYWLDIYEPNIGFKANQLPHLRSRPLNLTAINLIKKRCLLVRALGKSLEHHWWLESTYMSHNIFNKFAHCNDKVQIDILKAMEKERLKGDKDCVLFLHLDGYNHENRYFALQKPDETK